MCIQWLPETKPQKFPQTSEQTNSRGSRISDFHPWLGEAPWRHCFVASQVSHRLELLFGPFLVSHRSSASSSINDSCLPHYLSESGPRPSMHQDFSDEHPMTSTPSPRQLITSCPLLPGCDLQWGSVQLPAALYRQLVSLTPKLWNPYQISGQANGFIF